MKRWWYSNLLHYCIVILFVAIVLLPSCSSKNVQKKLQNPREIKNSSGVFHNTESSTDSEFASSLRTCSRIIREQEAKMVDVPFPLGAVPLDDVTLYTQDESVVAYQCTALRDDLVTFYTLEMEREGWCNFMNTSSSESLLVFVKPQRVCVVSLRGNEQSQQCQVFIFMGKKNTFV